MKNASCYLRGVGTAMLRTRALLMLFIIRLPISNRLSGHPDAKVYNRLGYGYAILDTGLGSGYAEHVTGLGYGYLKPKTGLG